MGNNLAMAATPRRLFAIRRLTTQPVLSGEKPPPHERCEVEDAGARKLPGVRRGVGQKPGRMPAYRTRFDHDD